MYFYNSVDELRGFFYLFILEIWCLTLCLFRRLGELTMIVPCYFSHSSVNLGYKIAL